MWQYQKMAMSWYYDGHDHKDKRQHPVGTGRVRRRYLARTLEQTTCGLQNKAIFPRAAQESRVGKHSTERRNPNKRSMSIPHTCRSVYCSAHSTTIVTRNTLQGNPLQRRTMSMEAPRTSFLGAAKETYKRQRRKWETRRNGVAATGLRFQRAREAKGVSNQDNQQDQGQPQRILVR